MRKLFVLVLILAAAFLYINRERLYLRDPLGSVARNGAIESGAQVYINASNDVLLENDNTPMYLNLLRGGQPVSAPNALKCIHYLACLLNDVTTSDVVLTQAHVEAMSAKEVRFQDSEGREVVVKLR